MGRKAKVKGKGRLYRRKVLVDRDNPKGPKKTLPTWWMDYSIDGKRVRKSTGTDKLEVAREILADTLADEQRNKYNPLRKYDQFTFEDKSIHIWSIWFRKILKTLEPIPKVALPAESESSLSSSVA